MSSECPVDAPVVPVPALIADMDTNCCIVDTSTTVSSPPSTPPPIAVSASHFELLHLVGEGAFGKVLTVRSLLDKQIYAMKVISKKLLKKKNHVSYVKSEREILTKLHHPFVVQLHFAFQSEKKLFMVMNFCNGGELFHLIRKRGLMLEKEARFYLSEMILALDFLHCNNIIHRDLKPENILLGGDGHVCITDFGLAKELGHDPNVRTLCGTSEYMAPEMLTRNGYGKAVDWWAMGALAFEMLVGRAPFTGKTSQEVEKKVLSEKPVYPSFLQPQTHSLLKGLLEKDPGRRLGATKSTMFAVGGIAALKQHPFFGDMDWNALLRKEITPPTVFENDPSDVSCFHEEFTSQDISLTFVEDAIGGNSGRTTPSAVSTTDDNSIYDGFGYMNPEILVTLEDMVAIEEMVAEKRAKIAKKRRQKEKNEAKKLEQKLAMEAAAKEEAEKKQLEAERKKLQAEQDLKQRMIAEEIRMLRGQCAKINQQLESERSVLEEAQKTARKYRKKARECAALMDKPSSELTPEQRRKVQQIGDLETQCRSADADVEAHTLKVAALTTDLEGKTNRLTELGFVEAPNVSEEVTQPAIVEQPPAPAPTPAPVAAPARERVKSAEWVAVVPTSGKKKKNKS